MKKLFLILIPYLFVLNSIAQKNYINGTITTKNNEVINGLINDKAWFKSPDEIMFKPTENGEIITYKPSDIKSFKTEQSYYLSQTLKIIDAQVKIEKLQNTPEAQYINKTIFLKVLIKSNISLYYYKDKNSKDHFFIQLENGDFNELIHYKYQTKKEVIMQNNKYIGQLSYYLKDCIDLKKLKTISYTKKNISNLINNYNECKGFESESYDTKNKARFEFSVKTGVTSSSLSFEAGENTILERNLGNAEFSNSIKPTVSLTLDMILPYWNNSIAVYTDLHYRYYDVVGNSSTPFYSEWQFENKIKASYLGSIVGVKYLYSFSKFKIFIGAGIVNSFIIDFESNTKEERTTLTTYLTNEYETFEDYKTYSAGFTIESGIEISKFILQYRYIKDNAMSNYVGINSKYSANIFLIGYKF